MKLVVVLALPVLLVGCGHSARNAEKCDPISGATRVQVMEDRDGVREPGRSFTDAATIQELVEFANQHRGGATPFDTMAAPEVTAAFYNGSNFLGAVGVGKDFIYVSCSGWRGKLTATQSEIAAFREMATPQLRP